MVFVFEYCLKHILKNMKWWCCIWINFYCRIVNDVRCKGRGPYKSEDIEEHINRVLENESMDYYTYAAFSLLIEKTKSFSKTPQIEKLFPFLQDTYIDEIVVIWHSCSIDYTYFEYLNKKYPSVLWSFNPHDISTKENIEKLINRIKIKK